jgi:DNA-binding HxlR family transcriptional regulator
MELLDERWTLLVVRELVTGSQHFNALRRGRPRMSPSLLSKRLQQLGAEQLRIEGPLRRVVPELVQAVAARRRSPSSTQGLTIAVP